MSDLALEILKDIQRQASEVRAGMVVLPRLAATTATLVRAVAGLQQEVRMIRASVNDMAHARVSTGEIEALYTELDQLRANVQERETRLHMLEHRDSAE